MLTIRTLIEYIIESYSTRKLWISVIGTIVCAIAFGVAGVFIGVGQPLGDSNTMINILDTQLNYTVEQAYQHIEAYGSTGRSVCLFSTLFIDSIFPLFYGAFFMLLLSSLFKKTAYKAVVLLPLLVIIVDYFENSSIALLLINYPEQLPTVAYWGSLLTILKWFLLASTIMWISIGFFIKNRREIKARVGL